MKTVQGIIDRFTRNSVLSGIKAEEAIRLAMLEGYKLACEDCGKSSRSLADSRIEMVGADYVQGCEDCIEGIIALRDSKTPESFL